MIKKLGELLTQQVFSLYELIRMAWKKIDEVIDALDRKVEQGDNFEGSWWGITKPQFAEPGIAGVVDLHDTKILKMEKQISYKAYNPNDYLLNGEQNYNNAFIRIMDLIAANGSGAIELTPNIIYNGDIVINTSNVRIVGSGILKGTIKIHGVRYENENQRYYGTNNIVIEGITIDGEDIRNGIEMQYAYGITISNVTFKNCIKSTTINTIDYFQHVSRVEINNNRFHNCRYGLFIDREGFSKYIAGDIRFNNNIQETVYGAITNTYYSVFVNGLDGLVCNGNTFFGSAEIKSNIHINNSQWIIVSDNNLFVPLEHCIHILNSKQITVNSNNLAWSTKDSIVLDACLQFVISNNNITWYSYTGRGFTASGINIKNQDNCYGLISNNSILFPYVSGITTTNAGKLTISGNTITNFESTFEPIYINGSSYCVLTNNTTLNFSKANKMNGFNHVESGTYTGSKTIVDNSMKKLATKTITDNSTSINIDDVSCVILANTEATTITEFVCSDLHYPRIVYLFSYNDNTKISRTATNTQFSGSGSTINIGSLGCITLLINGGKILDISRNNCTES